MLPVVVLFLFIGVANAVFPRECATPYALQNKICCPYFNGSPCGYNTGNGVCTVVTQQRASGRIDLSYDDRYSWSTFFYNTTCVCRGNFAGYNCGYCKPGYTGPTCSTPLTIMRREIREYSVMERKALFAKLHYCKSLICKEYVILTTGDRLHRDAFKFRDASYYDVAAFAHYYAIQPTVNNSQFFYNEDFAHRSSAFFPWHRRHLLFAEHLMQICLSDPTFAWPYYDWRLDSTCSICHTDFLCDSDEQGALDKYCIFSTWRSVCGGYDFDDQYCVMSDCICERPTISRKPGYHPAYRLPTKADVDAALTWSTYDTFPYNTASTRSFRNIAEGFMSAYDGVTPSLGLHNLFHVYCGGTMIEVPISPNDPIFYFHHCFMDKIYEVWLRTYGPDQYPPNTRYGHAPHDCMPPFYPCSRPVDYHVPCKSLGYDYSSFQGM